MHNMKGDQFKLCMWLGLVSQFQLIPLYMYALKNILKKIKEKLKLFFQQIMFIFFFLSNKHIAINRNM